MVGNNFLKSLLLLVSLSAGSILSSFSTIEIFSTRGASGIVEDRGLGASIEPHDRRELVEILLSGDRMFTTGYQPGRTVEFDPVLVRCFGVMLSDT